MEEKKEVRPGTRRLTAQMWRRILMTLVGVSISGVSVGLFSTSNLGFDPFQAFAHGTWMAVNRGLGLDLSYGTYYMTISLIMFAVFAVLNRKLLGLGTLFNLFLVGYIADFSGFLCQTLFPDPDLLTRSLLLAVGIVTMCFAMAMYFVADLGVSVYDAVALTITERQPKFKFHWCRIVCDCICVAIGFYCGAAVGIGTVISAFFMGPLIDFFRRTVARPMRYGRKGAEQSEQPENA